MGVVEDNVRRTMDDREHALAKDGGFFELCVHLYRMNYILIRLTLYSNDALLKYSTV